MVEYDPKDKKQIYDVIWDLNGTIDLKGVDWGVPADEILALKKDGLRMAIYTSSSNGIAKTFAHDWAEKNGLIMTDDETILDRGKIFVGDKKSDEKRAGAHGIKFVNSKEVDLDKLRELLKSLLSLELQKARKVLFTKGWSGYDTAGGALSQATRDMALHPGMFEESATVEVPISDEAARQALAGKQEAPGSLHGAFSTRLDDGRNPAGEQPDASGIEGENGEHGFDDEAITSLSPEERIPFEVWAYGDEYGGPATLADVATEINSRGKDDEFQQQLEEYAHGNEAQIKQAIDQLVAQGILTPAGPTAWSVNPSYQPPVPAQKALKQMKQMRELRKFAQRLVMQKTWEEWDAAHRGQDISHVDADLKNSGFQEAGRGMSDMPGATHVHNYLSPEGHTIGIHTDPQGKVLGSGVAPPSRTLTGTSGGGPGTLSSGQKLGLGMAGAGALGAGIGALAAQQKPPVQPTSQPPQPQTTRPGGPTPQSAQPGLPPAIQPNPHNVPPGMTQQPGKTTTTAHHSQRHGHGGGHTTTTHTTHRHSGKSMTNEDLIKNFASRLIKHGVVPPEPPTHTAQPGPPQGGVGGVFGQTTPSAQQAAGQSPGSQPPSAGPGQPATPQPGMNQPGMEAQAPNAGNASPINIHAGALGGGSHATMAIPFHPGASVSFQYKPPGTSVPVGATPLPGQAVSQPKPPPMPGGPVGSQSQLQGAGKAPNPPTGQYPPNPTPGQGPTDGGARTGSMMPKLQAGGDPSQTYGVARSMPKSEEVGVQLPSTNKLTGQASHAAFPSTSQDTAMPQGQKQPSVMDTNKPPAFGPQTKQPDPNSVNGEDYSGSSGMSTPIAHGSQTPNPQPGNPVGTPSATMPGMDRTVVGDKWQPTPQQMPGAYGTGAVASSNPQPPPMGNQTPSPAQAMSQQQPGVPLMPPMYANPANPTPQITPSTPQPGAAPQQQPGAMGQQAGADKIQPTPDHQAMLDQKLGNAGFQLKQPLVQGNRTFQHMQTGEWAEASPKADGSGAVDVNFHDRTGAQQHSVDTFSALDQHLATRFGQPQMQKSIKDFAQVLVMVQKARREWIGKPIGPYSSWSDCKKAGKSDRYCGYLYHHASPHAKDETDYKDLTPEKGVPGRNKTMPSDFATGGSVNINDWVAQLKTVREVRFRKSKSQ